LTGIGVDARYRRTQGLDKMQARNLIDLEVGQQSCQPFTVGVLRNGSDEPRTFGRWSREHIEQHAGAVLADGGEDTAADVVRRDQDVPPPLESARSTGRNPKPTIAVFRWMEDS
jgi:hypothetical protein